MDWRRWKKPRFDFTAAENLNKGDVSLPPGAYLGMARGLGEYDLVEVEGSHEAFFTNPGVVAEGFQQALK